MSCARSQTSRRGNIQSWNIEVIEKKHGAYAWDMIWWLNAGSRSSLSLARAVVQTLTLSLYAYTLLGIMVNRAMPLLPPFVPPLLCAG